MPQTARQIDYRVSRVVILCKDCGSDVGLYPARHRCGFPNDNSDSPPPPVPALPRASGDSANSSSSTQDNSWGALWNKWTSAGPSTTTTAASSTSTEANENGSTAESQAWGIWNKIKAATVGNTSDESDPDEVSNALRNYYKDKGGPMPEFLKPQADRRVKDDDLDQLASKLTLDDRRRPQYARRGDSRDPRGGERRPRRDVANDVDFPPPRSTASQRTLPRGQSTPEIPPRRSAGSSRNMDRPAYDEGYHGGGSEGRASSRSRRDPDSAYTSPTTPRRPSGSQSDVGINARREYPTMPSRSSSERTLPRDPLPRERTAAAAAAEPPRRGYTSPAPAQSMNRPIKSDRRAPSANPSASTHSRRDPGYGPPDDYRSVSRSARSDVGYQRPPDRDVALPPPRSRERDGYATVDRERRR
ncbi:hypothetical protein RI367_003480 [Sorochytrium milnesiophthora]